MVKPDFKKLREDNLNLAKQKIRESINEDNHICQAISRFSSKNLEIFFASFLSLQVNIQTP